MNFEDKSEKELRDLALALQATSERRKYNYIDFLFMDEGPLRRDLYPKHIEFLNAGREYTERAFIAANQVGKSLTGLYEAVTHATGNYPAWWKGKRFEKPCFIWVCGDRGAAVKDSIQKELVGKTGEIGTGLIPKDKIAAPPTALQGTPGGYGEYFVKHKSGGISTIVIKTYNSGKEAFEAARVDVIMLDEECPLEIYIECLMRTITTRGIVYLTFTPDSGLTDTVLHFLEKPTKSDEYSSSQLDTPRYYAQVGWDDVPHLSDDYKAKLLRAIPPHMRDVKTKGSPYLGRGAIYPISEDEIVVKPFEIPCYWPRAYAFDPGWNKTAAIWGAHDRDSDILYLYSEYYRGFAEPSIHATAIQSRGKWIRGVSDPAARGGGRGKDGIAFLEAYENEGLMLSLADNSVEVGLMDVFQRLSTGRLKVFNTLQNWLYEYRIYRRNDKDGKVVKKNDHLMDATRYLVRSGFEVMDIQPEPKDSSRRINYTGRNSTTGY